MPSRNNPPTDLVEAIAKRAARRARGVYWRDVAQDVYVRWMENYDEVQADVEAGRESYYWATLARWTAEAARTELDAIRHCQGVDGVTYSRGQLRMLLPHLDEPDLFGGLAGQTDGDGRQGDPATSGDALATWADLRRAWEALDEADRELLRLAYSSGHDPDWTALGATLGLTADAARKRGSRALGRMSRFLGGR